MPLELVHRGEGWHAVEHLELRRRDVELIQVALSELSSHRERVYLPGGEDVSDVALAAEEAWRRLSAAQCRRWADATRMGEEP
jgi:hypothetical protein